MPKPAVEFGRRWLGPLLIGALIGAVSALFLLPAEEARTIRAMAQQDILAPPPDARIPSGLDHRRLDTVSAPVESQSSVIRREVPDDGVPAHPEAN